MAWIMNYILPGIWIVKVCYSNVGWIFRSPLYCPTALLCTWVLGKFCGVGGLQTNSWETSQFPWVREYGSWLAEGMSRDCELGSWLAENWSLEASLADGWSRDLKLALWLANRNWVSPLNGSAEASWEFESWVEICWDGELGRKTAFKVIGSNSPEGSISSNNSWDSKRSASLFCELKIKQVWWKQALS